LRTLSRLLVPLLLIIVLFLFQFVSIADSRTNLKEVLKARKSR